MFGIDWVFGGGLSFPAGSRRRRVAPARLSADSFVRVVPVAVGLVALLSAAAVVFAEPSVTAEAGLTADLPADLPASALADHRILLLGERHDHPEQHLNQARWLDQIAGLGSVVVVMEMVSTRQADAIAEVPATADAWAKALDWEASGWPEFALYAPIFEVIAQHQIPVVAGTVGRDGHGMGDMANGIRKRLGDVGEPSATIAEHMAAAVREGHCNLLPEEMVGPMVEIQWLKDAFMARQVTEALARTERVVLIAGNGHTQTDSGVPVHLSAFADQTLAVVQVEAGGADEPEVADPIEAEVEARVEAVRVITPAIPMPDHCAALRAHFGEDQSASD